MTPNDAAVLASPERLRALERYALLDTPVEASFDRLTRLAAQVLRAPAALVTLITGDRQFIKSCVGVSEPWCSLRETPLSHSFCQHAVRTGQPLVIRDAREHPLVRDNPAIEAMGVIAYAGIPLVTSGGQALGSFCVLDSRPREWRDEEIAILRDLAAAVMTEIELRAEVEERRRVERALRESEERFQQLERGIREVFWITDPHTGALLYVSPAFEEIWGRSAEALYRDRSLFLESVHPEDRARVFATSKQVENGGYAEDYRIVRPDGEVRWIRDRGFPVRDAEGRVCRIAGVANDVTERKEQERMESFLAAAGATLSTTLDLKATLKAVGELCVPFLSDLCIVDLVEAEQRLVRARVALREPAERGWAQRLRTEHPPRWEVDEPGTEAIRTGRTVWVEEVSDAWLAEHAQDAAHADLLRRMGVGSLLAVPLVVRGQRLGSVTLGTTRSRRLREREVRIAEDFVRRAAFAIDNAQLYRRAQETTQAREELLSIVANELTAPLQAARHRLDALIEGAGEGEARTMLEAARDHVEQAACLASDLMQAGQLAGGHLRVRVRPEDPLALLGEVVERHQAQALARSVWLGIESAEPLPHVMADPQRARQVLSVLLGYLLRVVPEGSSLVLCAEPAPGEVRITLTSDAPLSTAGGDSSDEADARFRDSLSLAVVRGIMEAQGGRFASSAPEAGGFAFLLALRADPRSGPDAEEERVTEAVIPLPARVAPSARGAGDAAEWREHLLERARAMRSEAGLTASTVERRLRDLLLNALYVGHLAPGDRVSSVRELGEALGLGFRSVLRIYRRLAAEGVLELRGRSGVYVAEREGEERGETSETGQWLIGVLTSAAAHQIRVPLIPELLRRYTVGRALRCACVETTRDHLVALSAEVGRQFGVDTVQVALDELEEARALREAELPAALAAADVWVTTVFHESALRPAARRLGKPLVVASLAPAVVAAVEAHLRDGPLTVVCVEASYGDRVRGLRGGALRDRIHVVLAGDEASLARLDPSRPVLMTRAASEQLHGHPFRLVVPLAPLYSPDFARRMAEAIVHANGSPRPA